MSKLDYLQIQTVNIKRISIYLMLIVFGIYLATLSTPANAAALPEQNKCADGQEYSNGFCYTPCAEGYEGVGPACWSKCPAGYKNEGVFCDKPPMTKDSYGRGIGHIKDVCPQGKQNQDGLCYNPCPSGWKGVGPVCWKGIKSQGRGVGTVPNACPNGTSADADGLCYPPCNSGYSGVGPVCWKACPSGYTNIGAICTKTVAKTSYGRGAGYAATNFCQGLGRKFDSNYSNVLKNYTDTKKFTMIVASDPQMPWWMWGDDPDCKTDDCVLAKSKQVNAEQIKAMNDIVNTTWYPGSETGKGNWPTDANITHGGGISKPLGVIMNGDLTAYWHFYEADLYRQYYEPDYKPNTLVKTFHKDYIKPASDPTLALPIFPGLGNHDYENNLGDDKKGDCTDYGTSKTFCAKSAVNYMKDMVYCDGVNNFINTLVDRFDEDSLAYSWDIGNIHFVQLNNHPAYTADAIGIKSSMNWLKTDLRSATAAGQKIVINMHDFGAVSGNSEFKAAINGQNVVAVFAGHLHEEAGQIGNMDNVDAAGKSYQFPYFFSGSSDFQTFMLVEFADTYMNVSVISSKDGKPVFVHSVDELEPSKAPGKSRSAIELPATYMFHQ